MYIYCHILNVYSSGFSLNIKYMSRGSKMTFPMPDFLSMPPGEISLTDNLHGNYQVAGMGTKRIRVSNLSPEGPNDTLPAALAHFGKVQDIHAEIWSKAYRYSVANGIRQVSITLTGHVPSHLTVAWHRLLPSYDGQPVNDYG